MQPELSFRLGSRLVAVGAYPLFITLAILTVVLVSYLIAVRRGLPGSRTLFCLLLMAAGALVGARLFDVLLNWQYYWQQPMRIIAFKPLGFAVYGGLMLSAATGVAACRLARLDPWRLADASAPALGLGVAVARVGCFLNGCCYGLPTSLPWGVNFAPGSEAYAYQRLNLSLFSIFQTAPKIQPLHPTQLYELLAGLIGALLAASLLRRKFFDGAAFLVFVIWFTIFRYFNDFLRVSAAGDMPGYFYPVFYGLILLAAVLIWNFKACCRKQGKTWFQG